jgi:hypothetical protein
MAKTVYERAYKAYARSSWLEVIRLLEPMVVHNRTASGSTGFSASPAFVREMSQGRERISAGQRNSLRETRRSNSP